MDKGLMQPQSLINHFEITAKTAQGQHLAATE